MGMAAVAAEIDACAGGQVQQVLQPEAETVVLTLRASGRNRHLLLSVHARHARAHFLPPRRPAAPDQPALPAPTPMAPPPVDEPSRAATDRGGPPAFCMLLRKHLKGAILVAARQIGFDRVLRLTFRYAETEVCLVLEAMGKHSNLMLLNAEGTVLDAIKRVSSRESRLRPVHPGVPYTPPPTGRRADPAAATPESVAALLAEAPSASLDERLLGAYPLGPTALAAIRRRCDRADPTCLAEALRAVADPSTYAPAVLLDARGVPVGVSFLPDDPVPAGGSRQPAASASEALAAYFAYRIAHEAFEGRRRQYLRALDDAVRFSQRRIREAEEGTEAARAAPNLGREATLLLANLGRIPRGAERITVVDFYDPEQHEVTLTLDPAVPAQEQAEKRFKRARKLVDAVPHLERQWEEEQARLERLQAVRPQVETATTMPELEAVAPLLDELGLFRERRPAPVPRRAAESPGVQCRQIGAFEVLLGRNATENDHLTTRVADPDDIWLHARGITSAHVVIRTGRHPERVPHAVLLEAARLCARHSTAKHSRLVPVDYTLRKYVVKRRGSPPGTVQYTHEKTLHVEPGLA